MALSKVADAREFSDEALAAEILTAKRKLFQLRLEKATGRLETTHNFKHTRRWIAQLLTVERERELAAEEESVSEETSSETSSTVETSTTEAIAETEPVTEEE